MMLDVNVELEELYRKMLGEAAEELGLSEEERVMLGAFLATDFFTEIFKSFPELEGLVYPISSIDDVRISTDITVLSPGRFRLDPAGMWRMTDEPVEQGTVWRKIFSKPSLRMILFSIKLITFYVNCILPRQVKILKDALSGLGEELHGSEKIEQKSLSVYRAKVKQAEALIEKLKKDMATIV